MILHKVYLVFQEVFEARTKRKATIAEISGEITNIESANGKFKVVITSEAESKNMLQHMVLSYQ